MKRTAKSYISFLPFWVLLCGTSFAQVTPADSAQTLEAVEVTAYELKRSIFELASPLAVINKKQLNRFANNSLVPVMNSQPGIRLEERSPGSYRLNIRGSSLRAPFGVRNVKIYYNGIPYTTPGGDSYFNHIGFAGITSMEIIKGPGSSMYGAGTGGVLLMRTEPLSWKEGGQVMFSGGSYGSQNHSIQAIAGNEQFRNALLYQDQRSNGYRNQTALKRKVFNWDLSSRTGEKSRLDAHFMYADLFYETPGALNKKEFDSIPRSARPRSGATPGAVEAQASLRQTTFLTGFKYTYNLNSHWSDQTSLYGAFTRLRNPGIFNYSWVNEAHAGGRTVMSYRKEAFTFHTGMEMQKGFTTAKTFKNVNGTADSLRSDDEVNNLLLVGFAQASYRFKSWTADAGISINRFNSDITRLSVLPSTVKQKKYNNQWAPRIAVLKKVRSNLSVYASVGKGFSPPTTSELLPSSGIIATELQAEKGLNVELGSRGKLWKRRISYDITLFQFQLRDAIVVRRDALGRDNFVNAGSTRQQGIETQLNFLLGGTRGFLSDNAAFWISYTGYSFRYVDFKKGSTDFSGKQMPSVPKHTIVAGLDLYTHKSWYALLTATYTDAIPLNDANTDWSAAYRIFSFRCGWKKKVSKQIETDIFISADNLTDERYSLGFDLNAAAGRYYNTAPGRNWTAGLIFSMLK